MAAVATISLVDAQKILDSWAKSGPSDDEQIKFANAALKQLENPDDAAQFAQNVELAGIWANEVDAAFDRVTRGFVEMTAKYGSLFPDLFNFLDQWRAYEKRWVQYIANSRDVASTHISILRRFDRVFLEMVEQIQTNQDRLDVIVELQQFIKEDHSDSVELTQNFLRLSRDIEFDFVPKFGTWIVQQGQALAEEARRLIREIDNLQSDIQDLDKKINDANIALAVSGACLNIIGLIVSGSIIAAFKSQRNGKVAELERKQAELAEVKKKEMVLAKIQTDFEDLKPDIALICDRLALFAQIWSSIRGQTVQFQAHLEGGAGSETSLRFKVEVRLARAVCTPLMSGLQKYINALGKRARLADLSSEC